MRIVLDRTRCASLGLCEAHAPEMFEVNDDGELMLLREDIADGELDAVQRAVDSCPTAALRLEH